jgi:hypothetical protein
LRVECQSALVHANHFSIAVARKWLQPCGASAKKKGSTTIDRRGATV